jgi:hypothetical protein
VLTGCLLDCFFDRCFGIEILESLYKKSLELGQVYKNAYAKYEMRQGDFLENNWWTEADVVLANSTCYDMALMRRIGEKASLMRKGSWMISLTKKLPNADPLQCREAANRDWECVLSIKMTMSWGYATVNVQRKVK